jgi:hypothetical protein
LSHKTLYRCDVTTLKAHFDGKVLVPDEPVDLPVNCSLEVRVQLVTSESNPNKPLARLAELARELPSDVNAPRDGASQHDHYLYRTPKRE